MGMFSTNLKTVTKSRSIIRSMQGDQIETILTKSTTLGIGKSHKDSNCKLVFQSTANTCCGIDNMEHLFILH